MNQVITIPNLKSLAREKELVLISRSEYEAFNALKKVTQIRKGEEWFWTPEWQTKEFEADIAIRLGRISGQLSNHKQLLSALKQRSKA